jgi:hypothetical protein
MAVNTTIQRLARNVRTVDVGEFSIDDKPVLPVAVAGDSITLFTVPCDMRLYGAHLRSLAAQTATAKLQLNRGGTRTDLTAATTAGSDSRTTGAGLVPIDLKAGDMIEVLVGGTSSNATAIEYDLLVRRA